MGSGLSRLDLDSSYLKNFKTIEPWSITGNKSHSYCWVKHNSCFSSVNSATHFNLIDHHHIEREYKSMYTVIWKLRSQLLTVYIVILSMYNVKEQP
jgi:hypothetical protein